MVPGDLGTFEGLDVDAFARVRAGSGNIIEGLYAVGNDAANFMSGSYVGPGCTIGPAITFAFVAAHHIAGVSVDSITGDC